MLDLINTLQFTVKSIQAQCLIKPILYSLLQKVSKTNAWLNQHFTACDEKLEKRSKVEFQNSRLSNMHPCITLVQNSIQYCKLSEIWEGGWVHQLKAITLSYEIRCLTNKQSFG